jgi:hypothetical protein
MPAVWQIDKVTVNGDDITQIFIDSNNCSMHFSTKDCVNFLGQCGPEYYGWYYHLIDGKSNMEFEMTWKPDHYSIGPFSPYMTSIWDIHRLTNKDLWIECNYEGSNYYIKMHKIKQY